MTVYLQLSKTNHVTDCVTFPHGNYVQHQLDELPGDLLEGWYQLINNELVVDQQKKKEILLSRPMTQAQYEEMKQRQELTEEALNFLIMGGM